MVGDAHDVVHCVEVAENSDIGDACGVAGGQNAPDALPDALPQLVVGFVQDLHHRDVGAGGARKSEHDATSGSKRVGCRLLRRNRCDWQPRTCCDRAHPAPMPMTMSGGPPNIHTSNRVRTQYRENDDALATTHIVSMDTTLRLLARTTLSSASGGQQKSDARDGQGIAQTWADQRTTGMDLVAPEAGALANCLNMRPQLANQCGLIVDPHNGIHSTQVAKQFWRIQSWSGQAARPTKPTGPPTRPWHLGDL